jgi:hypothetical protein
MVGASRRPGTVKQKTVRGKEGILGARRLKNSRGSPAALRRILITEAQGDGVGIPGEEFRGHNTNFFLTEGIRLE